MGSEKRQATILEFYQSKKGDVSCNEKATKRQKIHHASSDDELEELCEQFLASSQSSNSQTSKPYYLVATFRQILAQILDDVHYAELFDSTDRDRIGQFTLLLDSIQMLYLKLYIRKRAWINISNIKYPEVSKDCQHLKDLKELTAQKFLANVPEKYEIEQALNDMKLTDLKSFVKQFKGFKKSTTAKAEIISSFLHYIRTTKSIFSEDSIEKHALTKLQKFFADNYFRINKDFCNILDRICLLYYSPKQLLSRLSTKSDFQWRRGILDDYMANISMLEDPVSTTNKISVIYSSREELIEFVQAFDFVLQICTLIAEKKYTAVYKDYFNKSLYNFLRCRARWSEKDSALEEFLRPFLPAEMYMKAIHECLASLEKTGKYQLCVEVIRDTLLPQSCYGIKYRPHWFTRAALISDAHLKNRELAVWFCVEGLHDPNVPSSQSLELYNRLSKIESSHEIVDFLSPIYKEKLFAQNTIFKDYDESVRVESVVIEHYLQNGFTDGMHCENSICHLLFGLLFFDIIYSTDYKDSFRYFQQTSPLDFSYQIFYERRMKEIDARVCQVEKFTETQLTDFLEQSWNENQNKNSFLIKTNFINLSRFLEIVCCITAPKIALICKFLAKNFRDLRRGSPDLIMWNMIERRIKFVEVKSLHDQLSYIQIIWLNHLTNFGLDAELCRVKPTKMLKDNSNL